MMVYQIDDIISNRFPSDGYYVGIFEDTPDPDIEWPHRHAFFSLIWFTQGHGLNVIDFFEYEIRPNRIFAISPKQIHNWNYSRDSRGYFVLIDQSLALQMKIDFSSPYYDVEKNDLPFMLELLQRASSSKDALPAIVYFVSLLSASELVDVKVDTTVSLYRKYVADHLAGQHSVAYYADLLNVSADELNRLCIVSLGLTAKQVQIDIKITEAKRLLLYSTLQTAEIAFQLGFEDSSYFSRIFKKKTTMSPTMFKEKYLKER